MMKRDTRQVSAAALLLALGGLGAAGSAAAQDPAAQPEDEGGVETVVVTGERRSQNLQSAPVAATVMTESTLKAHDIQDVDDLEFSAPSLTVGSNGQSTQINIRGVGKEDNSGTATSAVAIYRDGVGTVSGFATGEPYYDIATIEVLRGPQGTFAGENAAGGALFINTRDPEIGGDYSGWVDAGVGNYQQYELSGALNIPISDTFAARIAYNHVNRDSFYDVFMDEAMTIRNPNVGDVDHNSFRLALLWEPDEHFSGKLKFDYSNLDYGGYAFGVEEANPDAQFFGLRNISDDPFVLGNNSTDNYAVDRIARLALDLKYTFDNGLVLRSLSGFQWVNSYIRNDDDGTVFQDRRQHINATWNIYSEEITLASPAEDRFDWIIGGFIKSELLKFPEDDGFVLTDALNYIPGVDYTELSIVWHTPRRTQAVFGQVSYDLTEDLTVQAGLRYQWYQNSEFSDLQFPPFDPFFPGGRFSPPFYKNYDEQVLTGKVALNWQATDDHFFYVFVATGNTTGGLSVVASNDAFVNQYTTDIEAGWKGKFFDDQFFTQVGGFYTLIDDYQAYFGQQIGGRTVTTFQNLEGTSKIYGLELSGQAAFGAFSADFGVSLIHSELGEAVILGAGGVPLNTKGKKQPFTPDFTAHIGMQYEILLGNDIRLTPRVDYAWTDVQTTTPIDQFVGDIPLNRIEEHGLINAKLTLGTDDWDVTLYGTNLSDEQYIEAYGGPGYNTYVNEPLRYGVRLHYTY